MDVFIDSNILLYYTLGTPGEIAVLQKIFSNSSYSIHISTQVVNEFCNVAIKKKMRSTAQIADLVQMFEETYLIDTIWPATARLALNIRYKYKLSFYDSLITASALENNCRIIYSQDLHHGLLIEKKMKIVDPFK